MTTQTHVDIKLNNSILGKIMEGFLKDHNMCQTVIENVFFQKKNFVYELFILDTLLISLSRNKILLECVFYFNNLSL